MKLRFLMASLLLGMAGATTLAPLDLADQVKKADLILHIKVKGIQVQNDNASDLPWRIYAFDVLETLLGDPKTLPASDDDKTNGLPTLAVLGGGDLTLEFAPELKPVNEEKGKEWSGEYIVMLYKPLSKELGKNYDSPIVGFNQGIYSVQNGAVAPLDNNPIVLEEADQALLVFKNKIVALRGAP